MSRPPAQLQKLFRLRYIEGIRDKQYLSSLLGVEAKTLRQYYKRICKRLNVALGATLSYEAALEKSKAFICPECLRMTVVLDGVMRVCRECGLELGRWELDESLPFDTTYAPTSSISLGRSLGDTLPPRQTYKVLLKSPTGRRDIGLRARFINIIHKANEPPIVKQLLEYGSRRLKDLGLDEDHVLAGIYADNLRTIGAFLSARQNHTNEGRLKAHRLARALLGETVKTLLPGKAEEVCAKLSYSEEERGFVNTLMQLMRTGSSRASKAPMENV